MLRRAYITPCYQLFVFSHRAVRPEDVTVAYDSGLVYPVKLYPAGATTNSEYGVTEINKIKHVLSTMSDIGMPLLVHGEVSDPAVDIFDREKVFLDTILTPLRLEFPDLKVPHTHTAHPSSGWHA
jgi:dihydroorotase